MDKQMKRQVRLFTLKVAAVLLILTVCFGLYAFVYKGRTEPPAKHQLTNRSAAVYTLQGQIQMLSQKENLTDFAFDGRSGEKEYGTYIIPGLKNTKTLLTAAGGRQAICTSMTPQGLAVTDKYVLISAYCHTDRHNSVIYVVDKESHRFVKEVILPGQPHVGGLAYDSEHDILWYSSNSNGIAQAISLTMESIESYDYEAGHLPIGPSQICSLYGIVRDSFMTFYQGCLYVGCFNKYTESNIARYAVDNEGKLFHWMDEGLGMNFEMAVPLDYSTISEQAQGMAFYEEKLLLSHSFGVLPSRLVLFQQSDRQLYVNENSAKSFRFPERLEQIVVEGEDLYVLFESAAYAYRTTSINVVDRVLKLSLPKMMEEHEKETGQARDIQN